MKLIKLDAIDSTNDFLKALASQPETENFTVVTAENQTKGKGQRGSSWNSEVGKNLIMSALVNDGFHDVNHIYDLNIAVALSVIKALQEFSVPDLSIKWPNDILSGTKKIGGILIENSIKSDGKIISIIGIGLNVNQIQFENLPKASSLAVITGREFNKEEILNGIVNQLKQIIFNWDQNMIDRIWDDYHKLLFKKGVPMPFEDTSGNRFMGIIESVNSNGKLIILLEDDSFKTFDIKEIQMLY